MFPHHGSDARHVQIMLRYMWPQFPKGGQLVVPLISCAFAQFWSHSLLSLELKMFDLVARVCTSFSSALVFHLEGSGFESRDRPFWFSFFCHSRRMVPSKLADILPISTFLLYCPLSQRQLNNTLQFHSNSWNKIAYETKYKQRGMHFSNGTAAILTEVFQFLSLTKRMRGWYLD